MARIFVIFLFIAAFLKPAYAEVYTFIDNDGITHFTDTLPSKERRSQVKGFRVFEKNRSKMAFNIDTSEMEMIIDSASKKNGLEKSLVKAVIKAESNFDPRAVSKKGAKGLMQLMPKTAYSMGVDNIEDPYANVHAGCKYLKSLIDRYNGDVELSLAAYNAGPEAVKKYQGIPPYQETINYVQKVINYYNGNSELYLQAFYSSNHLNDT